VFCGNTLKASYAAARAEGGGWGESERGDGEREKVRERKKRKRGRGDRIRNRRMVMPCERRTKFGSLCFFALLCACVRVCTSDVVLKKNDIWLIVFSVDSTM
jgi:hypothetical protein